MEKLNITQGEWKSRQQTNGDIHISSKHWNEFVKISFVHHNNTEEHRKQCLNHSSLIKDAGNTYQQCETLPSELLRQRTELLQALKEYKEALEKYMENTKTIDNDWQTFHDLGMNLRVKSEEIIAKATKL